MLVVAGVYESVIPDDGYVEGCALYERHDITSEYLVSVDGCEEGRGRGVGGVGG